MLRSPLSTLFPYTTLFRSLRPSGNFSLNAVPTTGTFCHPCNPKHLFRSKLLPYAKGQTNLCSFALSKLQGGHEAYYEQSDPDRKSTRLNSSHVSISYAVFC